MPSVAKSQQSVKPNSSCRHPAVLAPPCLTGGNRCLRRELRGIFGLEAYIRREYARLVLPRAIRIDLPAGENLPPHSVLSVEFDRFRGYVTLRPMWSGADAAENIERHVELMQEERILNVRFVVDLGHAWQSIFIPGLLDRGFEPRFVLPYAGKGDIVFFQFGGKQE